MGDRGVDGPHVPAESASEKKEGYLKHDGQALDKRPEWPFMEPIELALAVAASLNHRPSFASNIPVELLFSQHCNESGEQRDQQTRIHKTSCYDDRAGGGPLGSRDGGVFAWNGGLVEGEENSTKKNCRLLIGVRCEV